MSHFRRYLPLYLFLCLTLTCGSAAALDAEKLFRETKDSIVVVKIYDADDKEIGLGSGFFVSDGHAVVTNHHVIKDGLKIKVYVALEGGATITQDISEALALDVQHDLAVLYVSHAGKPLALLDRQPNIGEAIIAIGHPTGLERTISTGVISGIREHKQVTYYQMTAPISPGSSGGPVINRDGKVVGVASIASVAVIQNVNFAMPSSYVQDLLSKGKRQPLAEARRAAHVTLQTERAEARAAQIAAAPAGLPYKIGIFPGQGHFGFLDRQGHEGRTVKLVADVIKAQSVVSLSYSSYEAPQEKTAPPKAEKLWSGSVTRQEPNLRTVSETARARGLNAVVMVWGDSPGTWAIGTTPEGPPIEIYLIDIEEQRVYRRKGYFIDTQSMTERLLSEFLSARGAPPITVASVRQQPTTVQRSDKTLGNAPPPPPGYALVYIYRVNAPPTAQSPMLYINETKMVRIKEKYFSWAHVKEGTYAVTTRWPILVLAPELDTKYTFVAGETYYLKLTGRLEHLGTATVIHSRIASMRATPAEEEIRRCCDYLPAKVAKVN